MLCSCNKVRLRRFLLTETTQVSDSQLHIGRLFALRLVSFDRLPQDKVLPSVRNTPLACRRRSLCHCRKRSVSRRHCRQNQQHQLVKARRALLHPTNMAPAANTNSLPNREKAPAASHSRHGSKSMEGQSRAVAARSRTGSDAREWSHVTDPVKQSPFDTGNVLADPKSTTTTTMTTLPEHDVAAEIEKHLRLSGPRGVEIYPAIRSPSSSGRPGSLLW